MIEPYYQDENCTIYNGDCREILPELGEVDLVLTDPPYSVTQQRWDSSDGVLEVVRDSRLAVFTTGERLLAELICALPTQYRHIWVWDRVNRFTDFLNASRRPMRSHELVAVFSQEPNYVFCPQKRRGELKVRQTNTSTGNGSYGIKQPEKGYGTVKTKLHPKSIISFKGRGNPSLHPTEKPRALFKYLLETYPSNLTVDPYMGSGTTLRAAKDLGRKAIGIEIEEKYCEIAAKRLAQEVLDFG